MVDLRRGNTWNWTGLTALLLLVASPCAWAKATAGRFVVSADQKTVYDNRTKLTWQRSPPTTGGSTGNTDGLYNWADAKNYCIANTATLPGSGWRLPNIRELLSLVDRKATSSPAIDTSAFPNTPTTGSSYYWSASPYQGGSSSAWDVSFSNGNSGGTGVTNGSRVRCVR